MASGPVSAGQPVSIELTGAAPAERFEILINGMSVLAAGTVDETGSAAFSVAIPEGLPDDMVEISFSGEISGTTSLPIHISRPAPVVTISPESPPAGGSITVSVKGFGPGETITIRISGKIVGSAVTRGNGSFSITTRLPELEQGEYDVSLEGGSGEIATTLGGAFGASHLGFNSGDELIYTRLGLHRLRLVHSLPPAVAHPKSFL
jgi:hypothetical protein